MSSGGMWRCATCSASNALSSSLCTVCGTANRSSAAKAVSSPLKAGIGTSLPTASGGVGGGGLYAGGTPTPPLYSSSAAAATGTSGTPPPSGMMMGGAAAPSPSPARQPLQPHQQPQYGSASMTRGGGPPSSMATGGVSGVAAAAAANATNRSTRGGTTVAGTEQLTYLNSVVEQSRRYGQDIERSVEELAQLLHKKTVECEGLRAIASENYNGLRDAVRNEYEARLKSESRQQQELKSLKERLEGLQQEKNQLLGEVENLREVVDRFEQAPPPAPYSPTDNSLFNRVMRGSGNRGGDDGSAQGMLGAVHSWNLATKDRIPEGSHRDLINYINNLDQEHAKALHAGGVFDFMKVAMHRLCTPLPNGTFNDLPTVIGRLLRERRDQEHMDRLRAEAGTSIPSLDRDEHQEAVDLYLQDNPGKYQQLDQELEVYKGREKELYAKIRRDHLIRAGAMADVQGTMGGGDDTSADAASPTSSLSRLEGKIPGVAAADRSSGKSTADKTLELNARIVLMYRLYKPDKLSGKELNELLSKYPPEVLLSALIEKYGPEPDAAQRRELVRSMCSE